MLGPLNSVGKGTVWPNRAAPFAAPVLQYSQQRVLFGVTSETIAATDVQSPLKWPDKALMKLFAWCMLSPPVANFIDKHTSKEPGLFPLAEFKRLYKPEEIKVKTADGESITNYFLPAYNNFHLQHLKDGPSNKTVIIGHGYTSGPTAMMTIANVFRHIGFNVVLMSFRGHGHGSSGWITDIGFHSALDLAATVEEIQKKRPDDTLSYMGYSMGAAALMLYLQCLQREAHPDAVTKRIEIGTFERLRNSIESAFTKPDSFIVLDSGYAYLDLTKRTDIMGMINEWKQKPWVQKMARLRWPLLKKGSPQLEENIEAALLRIFDDFQKHGSKAFTNSKIALKDYSPAENLAASPLKNTPTLIVHGINDIYTPPSHAQQIIDTLRGSNPSATVYHTELPTAGHSAADLVHPLFRIKGQNLTKVDNVFLGKTYKQQWRDPKEYYTGLMNFLDNIGVLNDELVAHSWKHKGGILWGLEDPNYFTIKDVDVLDLYNSSEALSATDPPESN